MKTLLAWVLTLSMPCAAAEIKLAWDPSPTAGVTNYVLYASTNTLSATNLTTAQVRLHVGTNLTATVENILPGQWSFAATAMAGGIESDPSNIVIVEITQPPANLRTLILQYSATLTNFSDVGFFRLRLP